MAGLVLSTLVLGRREIRGSRDCPRHQPDQGSAVLPADEMTGPYHTPYDFINPPATVGLTHGRVNSGQSWVALTRRSRRSHARQRICVRVPAALSVPLHRRRARD